jgi:hypothetical protein
VIERCCHPRLAEKPLPEGGSDDYIRVGNLQRNQPAKFRIAGKVNDAKTTVTKLALNRKLPDRSA